MKASLGVIGASSNEHPVAPLAKASIIESGWIIPE